MLCTQLDIFREPLPDANPSQCTYRYSDVSEVYASMMSIMDSIKKTTVNEDTNKNYYLKVHENNEW